eukprot:1189229-Prorocentrum_minimum.AAC.2
MDQSDSGSAVIFARWTNQIHMVSYGIEAHADVAASLKSLLLPFTSSCVIIYLFIHGIGPSCKYTCAYSIDTWLEGTCKSFCPLHLWPAKTVRHTSAAKSVFALSSGSEDEAADAQDEDGGCCASNTETAQLGGQVGLFHRLKWGIGHHCRGDFAGVDVGEALSQQGQGCSSYLIWRERAEGYFIFWGHSAATLVGGCLAQRAF